IARACFIAALLSASGLLHHFLVDHLDVERDAVAELAERVLRHATLVLRRELIGQLGLDVVQRRAVDRSLLHTGDEIAQVATEESQVALGRHLAVTGDDVREIEPLEGVERGHPVFRIAVVQERHPVDERVARGDDLLLRQVDEQITVRVRAAEDVQLDLAAALVQCLRRRYRARRQGRLHLLELLEIRLGLPQVRLDARLRLGVARTGRLVLELLDLGGQRGHLLGDERHAAVAALLCEVVLRPFGGDDLDALAGGRVALVALPVIPVEVRVDDLADGLLGHRLNLLVDRAGRGRLGVGVDHHDAVIGHDHRGVAVDLVGGSGDGGVDAVTDLLQLEEVLFVGRRLGARGTTELMRIERVDRRDSDTRLSQDLSTRPLSGHWLPPSGERDSPGLRLPAMMLPLIGVFKLLKAALLLALAIALAHLPHDHATDVFERWTMQLHIDPDGQHLGPLVHKILALYERHLRVLSAGMFAYATLFAVEGVGLIMKARWAEWLTVIATASFV